MALGDRTAGTSRPTGAVGAVVAYLLVVVGIVLFAPELLASVLISGIGAALGITIGIAFNLRREVDFR